MSIDLFGFASLWKWLYAMQYGHDSINATIMCTNLTCTVELTWSPKCQAFYAIMN